MADETHRVTRETGVVQLPGREYETYSMTRSQYMMLDSADIGSTSFIRLWFSPVMPLHHRYHAVEDGQLTSKCWQSLDYLRST